MADCTCIGGRWCEVHSPGVADCPCDFDAKPVVEVLYTFMGPGIYWPHEVTGPVPGCPLHDGEVG